MNMHHHLPSDHITPYDRFALDEQTLIHLLAERKRHEGLIEYFGAGLHAELALLARATLRRKPTGQRVYVLPGIMGSQLGLIRGDQRPSDVLWLDPIDISIGRLAGLRLGPESRVVPLGAMTYTYLKLTLSLRKAGFDAVLLDYDWRRDIAAAGKLLAARIAADGCERVALVGHSMGGLVARAALTHDAGKRVSRVVMLGTPNAGAFGAVQALRGTYSVVRKLAQLDEHHDAESLASQIFSSFPGLHELLPSIGTGALDLFEPGAWPAHGPAPDAELLGHARGLAQRLAPADDRIHVIIGCNRITATSIALRDGDFEYEYTLRGDGTVPIELAQLPGAQHRYVACGHSDLPLSDRVIAATRELIETGRTRRFATTPPSNHRRLARVRDAELRRLYLGKVDWPRMSPAQRRRFLDTLIEPPPVAVAAARRKPRQKSVRPRAPVNLRAKVPAKARVNARGRAPQSSRQRR